MKNYGLSKGILWIIYYISSHITRRQYNSLLIWHHFIKSFLSTIRLSCFLIFFGSKRSNLGGQEDKAIRIWKIHSQFQCQLPTPFREELMIGGWKGCQLGFFGWHGGEVGIYIYISYLYYWLKQRIAAENKIQAVNENYIDVSRQDSMLTWLSVCVFKFQTKNWGSRSLVYPFSAFPTWKDG